MKKILIIFIITILVIMIIIITIIIIIIIILEADIAEYRTEKYKCGEEPHPSRDPPVSENTATLGQRRLIKTS